MPFKTIGGYRNVIYYQPEGEEMLFSEADIMRAKNRYKKAKHFRPYLLE